MRVDTLIMGKPRPCPLNFWKDPLGPWNLLTFEPTGTQEPFIPLIPGHWSPKKKPFIPWTLNRWILETPNLRKPRLPEPHDILERPFMPLEPLKPLDLRGPRSPLSR